jgi:gliding motility-associatede transport system auxiliary component
VLAVVVLANFIAGRHHVRKDLTENKAFSLSDQTLKVLEALPRPVTVIAFYEEGPPKEKLQDLLKEYTVRGPKLKYEFVDPVSHPAEAKRYGITEYGAVVLESGKQESRANMPDEEALTNALIKVTRDKERVVYFTSGHGERDLKGSDRAGLSSLKAELEKQHYSVKPLVLNAGVPADASVVVVAGPQKPFLDAEAGMIKAYLDKGGRLFAMQDPGGDSGLKETLAAYGVAVRKDFVIDKVSQLFGGDPRIPMVAPDGYDEFHAVTKSFRFQTFYPLASSIEIQNTLPEGVTATKLAQTSPYSWGETNEQEFRSGHMKLDQGVDTKGPLTLGAALVRKAAGAGAAKGKEAQSSADETRLLVFGDSDFLTNGYFGAAGNGDLALNGIAWLSEQEELVSIRPKTSKPSIVLLTREQAISYLWIIVAFAPVATIVTGVGIWVRRKRL